MIFSLNILQTVYFLLYKAVLICFLCFYSVQRTVRPHVHDGCYWG